MCVGSVREAISKYESKLDEFKFSAEDVVAQVDKFDMAVKYRTTIEVKRAYDDFFTVISLYEKAKEKMLDAWFESCMKSNIGNCFDKKKTMGSKIKKTIDESKKDVEEKYREYVKSGTERKIMPPSRKPTF